MLFRNAFQTKMELSLWIYPRESSFWHAIESTHGLLNSRPNSTISILLKTVVYRVKKWCKICKKTERDNRKELVREQDNLKRNEYEKMQKELFERARLNLEPRVETYAGCRLIPEFERNILAIILQNEVEERCCDETLMAEAVNYVLKTPLEDLRYFL